MFQICVRLEVGNGPFETVVVFETTDVYAKSNKIYWKLTRFQFTVFAFFERLC